MLDSCLPSINADLTVLITVTAYPSSCMFGSCYLLVISHLPLSSFTKLRVCSLSLFLSTWLSHFCWPILSSCTLQCVCLSCPVSYLLRWFLLVHVSVAFSLSLGHFLLHCNTGVECAYPCQSFKTFSTVLPIYPHSFPSLLAKGNSLWPRNPSDAPTRVCEGQHKDGEEQIGGDAKPKQSSHSQPCTSVHYPRVM